MNPEFEERSQEQITKQRIAVLQEGFRKQMLESSIVRTTALRFLIRYYRKKIIYWSIVVSCICLTIYHLVLFVAYIWSGK